jgi:hypothetical protein
MLRTKTIILYFVLNCEENKNGIVIFEPGEYVVDKIDCLRLDFPMVLAVTKDFRLLVADNKSHCIFLYILLKELVKVIRGAGLLCNGQFTGSS